MKYELETEDLYNVGETYLLLQELCADQWNYMYMCKVLNLTQ